MRRREIQMPDWDQPAPAPDFLLLSSLTQESAHEDEFHCDQLAPIDGLMMPAPKAATP